MTQSDWPFDQPPDCAVITLRSIVFDSAPIPHVTHDADDHGWQFLGSAHADLADAAVVALSEIVDQDQSVVAFSDLPPARHAWRQSPSVDWSRGPNEQTPRRGTEVDGPA